MAKIYVEGWAPEYGSAFETDEALADADRVDDSVEVAGVWEPVPGGDDGIDRVAFVDGVRRVDARLTLEDGDGPPTAGLCGTYGVGAVIWDRETPRAEVVHAQIDRLALFGNGRSARVPTAATDIVYHTESVPDSDPGALIQRFHASMRTAEAELAETLAREGLFVVADGPINDLSATEKVGYIKSHRRPYLDDEKAAVIGRLVAGERTPLFLIGAGGTYPKYSWYLRLADLAGGHSWSGIARAEVSSAHDLATARRIANRVTAILPGVASESHLDPRAPQNLVPIAALERDLRRRMGDPGFVYRALRAATMDAIA
jgi:hypothetical protein